MDDFEYDEENDSADELPVDSLYDRMERLDEEEQDKSSTKKADDLANQEWEFGIGMDEHGSQFCNINSCMHPCKDLLSFIQHVTREHKGLVTAFVCSVCMAVPPSTRRTIQWHMKTKHEDLAWSHDWSEDVVVLPRNVKIHADPNALSTTPCLVLGCREVFRTTKLASQHVREKHSIQPQEVKTEEINDDVRCVEEAGTYRAMLLQLCNNANWPPPVYTSWSKKTEDEQTVWFASVSYQIGLASSSEPEQTREEAMQRAAYTALKIMGHISDHQPYQSARFAVGLSSGSLISHATNNTAPNSLLATTLLPCQMVMPPNPLNLIPLQLFMPLQALQPTTFSHLSNVVQMKEAFLKNLRANSNEVQQREPKRATHSSPAARKRTTSGSDGKKRSPAVISKTRKAQNNIVLCDPIPSSSPSEHGSCSEVSETEFIVIDEYICSDSDDDYLTVDEICSAEVPHSSDTVTMEDDSASETVAMEDDDATETGKTKETEVSVLKLKSKDANNLLFEGEKNPPTEDRIWKFSLGTDTGGNTFCKIGTCPYTCIGLKINNYKSHVKSHHKNHVYALVCNFCSDAQPCDRETLLWHFKNNHKKIAYTHDWAECVVLLPKEFENVVIHKPYADRPCLVNGCKEVAISDEEAIKHTVEKHADINSWERAYERDGKDYKCILENCCAPNVKYSQSYLHANEFHADLVRLFKCAYCTDKFFYFPQNLFQHLKTHNLKSLSLDWTQLILMMPRKDNNRELFMKIDPVKLSASQWPCLVGDCGFSHRSPKKTLMHMNEAHKDMDIDHKSFNIICCLPLDSNESCETNSAVAKPWKHVAVKSDKYRKGFTCSIEDCTLPLFNIKQAQRHFSVGHADKVIAFICNICRQHGPMDKKTVSIHLHAKHPKEEFSYSWIESMVVVSK